MLDSFLEVSYGKTKHAQEMDRRVQLMRKLPHDLLMKIASGEEKLSYPIGFDGDEPRTWLDRFKDTPLFEEALEIEKQELENRMADQQRRQEEQANWQARDASRDELCIRRKMLELQLAELESGGGGAEEPAEAASEPAASAVAPEAPPVEEAAEQMKAAMVKEAITLRELEERTRERGRAAGKKWGRRRGATGGAKGGAGPGAIGGAITGLAFGGKRRLGRAAIGAALGAGTGAGLGGAVGARKGGRIGAALGEREAERRNIQRRAMIAHALRMRAAQSQAPGKAKRGSAELSKEAIGMLAGARGLWQAAKAGWGAAGKAGTSKVLGAGQRVGKTMGRIAQKSPATAAGLTAAGAAIPAAGVGYAMG